MATVVRGAVSAPVPDIGPRSPGSPRLKEFIGRGPRVATVHDYITQLGGAERVVLALMRALPESRLITSCYSASNTFPDFRRYDIETMWMNKWPIFRKDPRLALPLLAGTFNRHHVTDVDVVVCSSSGWSHGISTDAPKIVYCHNPARWLYQADDYFGRFSGALRHVFERRAIRLREWDKANAREAAVYLVNSSIVRDRVRTQYGIEARIVPPPPGLSPDGPMEALPHLEPGYLLSVARQRAYKNVLGVAEAVESLPGERLVAVGGIPERPDGRKWSDRVVSLSRTNDAQLRWLYANAGALIAYSQEDFGLTPVEAFGFGTPVLAVREGGYVDTCVSGLSGLWIEEPTVDGVVDSIRRFRDSSFDSVAIKQHGANWSKERFATEIRAVIEEVLSGPSVMAHPRS